MPAEKIKIESFEDVGKGLEKISEAIETVQESNDALKEKYDGLHVDVITENSTEIAKAMELVQELRQKREAEEAATEERIKAVELELARGGGDSGGAAKEALLQEYDIAMNGYYRKAMPLPEELKAILAEKMAKYQLPGGDSDEIKALEAKLRKDMISGVGPTGGYWVLPERSSNITSRVFETSPMRPIAMVVSTSSNTYEQIIDDQETDSVWVGEVETRADTNTPEIGLIEIPVHTIHARPRLTQNMLDDAGHDVEGWLTTKVSREFGRKENSAFVVGDGSKKPKGFLSYDAWASAGTYERDAIEQFETTTASVIDTGNDLIELQNALIEDYQPGAVWAMRRATFTSVMTLVDDNGQYLLNPNIIREGAEKVLMGNPVVFMADMPAVADNALAIAYGNFMDGYTIVDRLGLRVIRDDVTAPPFIKINTFKRVGGAVTNFESIKILKVKAA